MAFARAEPLIAEMVGYLAHELRCCVGTPDRDLLLLRWESMADHTEGFRQSPKYEIWKQLLHGFYDSFPVVEHYELASAGEPKSA
ncbi:MAG: antibiotic biosynthesis monooxygenase family protein [Geitlerinemataceae cyanobacterium]